jgi:cysteine desulfurase
VLESYFDNAATTPVDRRVVEEMLPYLTDFPGNASSIHSLGRKAHQAVDLARERIATLIGAEDPSQIIFTSGATESNQWVLGNFNPAEVRRSPFEHSSIREFNQEIIGAPKNDLNVQIWINNETGTVFQKPAGKNLVDATQGVGKLPFQVQQCDYVSMSAHKLYGPKGIGALYANTHDLAPLLHGGGQEFGMRSGTLNVPGIVGFGAAAAIGHDEMASNLAQATNLNRTLLAGLGNTTDWQINGGENRSPHILSLSFAGIEGESLLIELDNRGYCCSAGAACSSHNTEPSAVLVAFGVDPAMIRGTIRVSFGKSNTLLATENLAKEISQIVEKLRSLR